MEVQQRKEWKNKLTPSLIAITGVCHVGLGQYGLLINVEEKTEELEKRIMDLLERLAPDMPYVIRAVGRIKKSD